MFGLGYRLIPAANKFVKNTDTSEPTLVQKALIKKCRKDFYKEFYSSNRDQRSNSRLTNKANFIYQWSEGHGYNRKGNLSDII